MIVSIIITLLILVAIAMTFLTAGRWCPACGCNDVIIQANGTKVCPACGWCE